MTVAAQDRQPAETATRARPRRAWPLPVYFALIVGAFVLTAAAAAAYVHVQAGRDSRHTAQATSIAKAMFLQTPCELRVRIRTGTPAGSIQSRNGGIGGPPAHNT